MRKSVKLAAASTLAAFAAIGGSATAAGAADAPRGTNVCGNDLGGVVASSDDGTTTVTENGVSYQIICQNGKENYAIAYYEGDVVGGELIYELASAVDGTASIG